MIRLHSTAMTRLLVAEAGLDSQVESLLDLVDGSWDAQPPWRNLGVGSSDPLLIARGPGGLRTIVFTLAGDWDVLEDLGIGTQFSLVVISAKETKELFVWSVPAQIEYHEVTINSANNTYRGRVDTSLLGVPHPLRAS